MKIKALLVLLMLPAGLLSAQETGIVPDTSATGTIDWVAEVLKGGATSIFLLLVGFVGFVFVIERLIVVRAANFMPRSLEKKLLDSSKQSDFPAMAEACKQDPSILAQVGGYIATHTHIPFEILSFGVTDMIARTVSRQHQRTYPLAVVATISPLLGLLGTIIGMIEAFQKVALMGDTGDASVLADSIGKALITTALGLIIAIPSLACYHYFKSKVNSYGIRLEEAVDNMMAPWLHPETTDQPSGEETQA
ncbi:MotA/TolQ/ExbB proton channel family protein [Coraliomargarita parva]|uniref:MotA/TolQ/ExbB proton channel family protein n=1 Tax=Coraliomargarita parva TaxID=3014050 RepID=UPI0022B49563|nr:MotA/TolQ/ExbB proton channel family protein [Coraliomargarita parva]